MLRNKNINGGTILYTTLIIFFSSSEGKVLPFVFYPSGGSATKTQHTSSLSLQSVKAIFA